ncbi:MAG: hypothetical protein DDT23_00358 [candidate division WS2 bacterium]|nr:hypothetical protein [Candidatus Lithacetigena glycinireducens]
MFIKCVGCEFDFLATNEEVQICPECNAKFRADEVPLINIISSEECEAG